ncbi:MAG: RHS repeat-associated core domain-containing protein [bacterium]
MNNFNVLRSNSKGFGANLTDFHSGQVKNLDRLVDSKNYDNTIINPDDIVLGTTDLTKNSVISKQNLGPYKYTYHNDSLRTIFADKHSSDNAVKQIETNSAEISHFGQKLTYTSFNSVETIRDTIVIGHTPLSDITAEIKKQFYYGSDGQRVLMVSYRNDTIVAKKYYIGEYEYIDSVAANRIKEVTYISAPTGLVAAKVKMDNVVTNYFVLTDHLGSITQLMDSTGYAFTDARFTYDAWGRLRDVRSTNPYMIGSGQTTAFHILDRGYCGHEHLLEHGIINMNGRIYDPITAQFMQADNYVQTPEDYIGYNRYSYCRYNPFKYTDPSGEMLMHRIDPGGNSISEEYLPNTSKYACDLVYNVLIWRNGKLRFGIGTKEQLGMGGGGDGGGAGVGRGVGGLFGSGSEGGGFFGRLFTKWFGKSDPKGDTKTGDIAGNFLSGDTPEEIAQSAERLIEQTGIQIEYDAETGEIYGRCDANAEIGTAEYELQSRFDELIYNTVINHERINLSFDERKSNFHGGAPGEAGTIVFSSYYLKNDESNPYRDTYQTADGRHAFCFGQIVVHEWLGHGLDWVNNYISPYDDYQADWDNRAVGIENYYLMKKKWPLRTEY